MEGADWGKRGGILIAQSEYARNARNLERKNAVQSQAQGKYGDGMMFGGSDTEEKRDRTNLLRKLLDILNTNAKLYHRKLFRDLSGILNVLRMGRGRILRFRPLWKS